jgi:hypothetical protein
VDDPTRWSDDPTAPEGAADLLRAHKRRPPPLDDRARAQAALAIAGVASATAPASAAAAAAKSGTIGLKVASVVAVALATGALAWLWARPAANEAPDLPPTAPSIASPAIEEAVPTAPTPMAPPPTTARSEEDGDEEDHEAPAVRVRRDEPEPLDPLAEETRLVRAAHDALEPAPRRALRIASEHARRFPDGVLTAERELLAIDALARLGRLDAARARRDGLARRFPSSPYVARADAILARAAD